MIPHQGFAFMNHADQRMDMAPLWTGILPWTVLILILVGIDAIFG